LPTPTPPGKSYAPSVKIEADNLEYFKQASNEFKSKFSTKLAYVFAYLADSSVDLENFYTNFGTIMSKKSLQLSVVWGNLVDDKGKIVRKTFYNGNIFDLIEEVFNWVIDQERGSGNFELSDEDFWVNPSKED